jgi:hypothetical protein
MSVSRALIDSFHATPDDVHCWQGNLLKLHQNVSLQLAMCACIASGNLPLQQCGQVPAIRNAATLWVFATTSSGWLLLADCISTLVNGILVGVWVIQG